MDKNESPPDLTTLIATGLEGKSATEAMEIAGLLIDLGGEAGAPEALDRAEGILNGLTKVQTLEPRLQSRAHYYLANIWGWRRRLIGNEASWVWRSTEIDNELLELHRALAHPGFGQLHVVERAQVLTNLGNSLNHIGRFVEAIEAWDRALVFAPTLAMANGNRGLGLSYYASSLYDPGHNLALTIAARQASTRACAPDALVESPGLEPALATFAALGAAIDAHFEGSAFTEVDLEGYSLGRSKRERAYRRWCLDNRLFLNPLNDVGPHPIAAQDIMTLPSLVTDLKGGPSPPPAIHYFNGLKQEYTTARFALYEGLTDRGVHFSDRSVLLYDTLDYPAFGVGVEHLKTAFRNAYALLDKVAFLLNSYFGLGHGERQVSFRNLWFRDGKGKKLHPTLDGRPNWPLRGLFWLSKDIYEDAFRQVTEPDAQLLYELRNHLEHKFVAVRDDMLLAATLHEPEPLAGVFAISFDQLASKALRQLKLARAALVYLAMGVHAEERRRGAERGKRISMSMPLFTWKDRWKRRD